MRRAEFISSRGERGGGRESDSLPSFPPSRPPPRLHAVPPSSVGPLLAASSFADELSKRCRMEFSFRQVSGSDFIKVLRGAPASILPRDPRSGTRRVLQFAREPYRAPSSSSSTASRSPRGMNFPRVFCSFFFFPLFLRDRNHGDLSLSLRRYSPELSCGASERTNGRVLLLKRFLRLREFPPARGEGRGPSSPPPAPRLSSHLHRVRKVYGSSFQISEHYTLQSRRRA